jgi:ketosteroid isomerase-like protein
MSQENVEIVREAWRVFAERGIDGAAGYFADDCVLEDFPDLPDRATYEGGDGLQERFRHFAETWDNFVLEPVEFTDAGGDVVVVVAAMTGHGKGGGTPMEEQNLVFVYDLRDGRIVRDRPFRSMAQALEAAGLSE